MMVEYFHKFPTDALKYLLAQRQPSRCHSWHQPAISPLLPCRSSLETSIFHWPSSPSLLHPLCIMNNQFIWHMHSLTCKKNWIVQWMHWDSLQTPLNFIKYHSCFKGRLVQGGACLIEMDVSPKFKKFTQSLRTRQQGNTALYIYKSKVIGFFSTIECLECFKLYSMRIYNTFIR